MTESKWGTDGAIWTNMSPPFAPAQMDVELVQRACPAELLDKASTARILVLGVTPALVGAQWPRESELHAVDFDPVMIDTLWKPNENARCHCAYWQAMPFPDAYFDLVIGDCSFNALPGRHDYDEVLREIARVRKPNAPLVSRFFIQPQPRLSLAGLSENMVAELAHLNAAAKRMLVLIAASDATGTLHFNEVPERIREEWGEVDDFLAGMGMRPSEVERAKLTYEFDQYLNFPTVRQIQEELGLYFEQIEFEYPHYDCGEFCPTVRCNQISVGDS